MTGKANRHVERYILICSTVSTYRIDHSHILIVRQNKTFRTGQCRKKCGQPSEDREKEREKERERNENSRIQSKHKQSPTYSVASVKIIR